MNGTMLGGAAKEAQGVLGGCMEGEARVGRKKSLGANHSASSSPQVAIAGGGGSQWPGCQPQ